MAAWDITTAGAAFEFETTLMAWPTRPIAVDTNHFFAAYQGSGSDGFVSVFEVNTSTWAVTEAGTLEHDTQNGSFNGAVQIDINHFVLFYLGSATTTDGWVQTFTVNTSTWAVTTAATRFLFDTDVGSYNSPVLIDDNHIINFWSSAGSDGFVQVFTVNTSTWAVTTAAASLEFDTVIGQHHSAFKIDTNHFINFYAGNGSDGFAEVFTVNTTTWAVTTAAARLEFDTQLSTFNASFQIDANHFINFWGDTSVDGIVQVFTVNTTTWAVTTASALLEFDTQNRQTNTQYSVSQIDANHFIHVWAGTDAGAGSAYDGFAQIFEVNTTTWAVTTAGAPFEFDTTQGEYNAISALIAGYDNKFLHLFAGSGDDGFAQVLSVEIPNYSPTVVLNTPADAATGIAVLPTLDFTGTDADGDSIEFEVQVDTLNTFDSQVSPTTPLQTTSDGTTAGNATATFGSNVAHGNTIIVVASSDGTFGSSAVTDNKGNTYTRHILTSGSGAYVGIFSASNVIGGSGLIVTFTNGISNNVVCAKEYSGTLTYDKSAGATGTGGTASSGATATTTLANEVIIGGVTSVVSSPTVGSGYGNLETNVAAASLYGGMEDKVVTSVGTQTATFGGISSFWACAVATFSVRAVPFLDKFSVSDAGFVNPDTGGDTHPFNSGENIQFTIQASFEELDETNTSGSTNIGFGDVGSGRDYLSQGFIPTLNNITAISFYLVAKSGNSDFGYRIWIDEANANSEPLNGIGGIGGSTQITNASLTTGALTKYTLSTSVTVVPGSRYVIVMAPWNTNTNAHSGDYQDIRASVTNPYTSGRRVHINTAYNSFSAPDSGNADILFEVYGMTNNGTLSNSTVYYWRLKGQDPLGTNTYGAWATTRSFTTVAGRRVFHVT